MHIILTPWDHAHHLDLSFLLYFVTCLQGLEREKQSFDRSTSHMTYLNSCANQLRRLRAEVKLGARGRGRDEAADEGDGEEEIKDTAGGRGARRKDLDVGRKRSKEEGAALTNPGGSKERKPQGTKKGVDSEGGGRAIQEGRREGGEGQKKTLAGVKGGEPSRKNMSPEAVLQKEGQKGVVTEGSSRVPGKDVPSKVTPDPRGRVTPDPRRRVTPDPRGKVTPDSRGKVTPDPRGKVTPDHREKTRVSHVLDKPVKKPRLDVEVKPGIPLSSHMDFLLSSSEDNLVADSTHHPTKQNNVLHTPKPAATISPTPKPSHTPKSAATISPAPKPATTISPVPKSTAAISASQFYSKPSTPARVQVNRHCSDSSSGSSSTGNRSSTGGSVDLPGHQQQVSMASEMAAEMAELFGTTDSEQEEVWEQPEGSFETALTCGDLTTKTPHQGGGGKAPLKSRPRPKRHDKQSSSVTPQTSPTMTPEHHERDEGHYLHERDKGLTTVQTAAVPTPQPPVLPSKAAPPPQPGGLAPPPGELINLTALSSRYRSVAEIDSRPVKKVRKRLVAPARPLPPPTYTILKKKTEFVLTGEVAVVCVVLVTSLVA